MASLDRVIEDPSTGRRVTFLVTADETNGQYLKMKEEVPPGSVGTPMHIHLSYAESLEVVEGALDVNVGGGKEHHRVLHVGEQADVPLNTWHRWWNSGDIPAAFTAEVRPARKFEATLRAAFGLMRDGKTNKAGVPTNLWELALIVELSETFIKGPPIALQSGIFGTLARIACRLGYDPEFSKYTR